MKNFTFLILWVLVFFPFFLFCQKTEIRTITGIVIEGQTGEKIIGAVIHLKNTELGAVSDIDGKFELEIPNIPDQVLTVHYGCWNNFEFKIKPDKKFYKLILKYKSPAEKSIVAKYGLSKISSTNHSFKSSFKIGFELGVQYDWLKLNEEKVRLVNPMIGIVYNFRH